MAVLLTDVTPPIQEVAQLGQQAVAVYGLLFQSAHQDRRYGTGDGGQRRDCGGTTYWSHKGIADTLSMSKTTVVKAIDQLLDNGFISIIGYHSNGRGTPQRIYRVTHPKDLEAQRYVISLFDEPPSIRYSTSRVSKSTQVIDTGGDDPAS